jgi:predicted peroxiredoxin
MQKAILFFLTFIYFNMVNGQAPASNNQKIKFLVHVTTGADNPTKAALAFLVARTAAEEGHHVDLFLAGDAVLLLRDDVLNKVTGVGTGVLAEHFKALAEKGVKFYLSGNSSKARGLTQEELQGKNASFALPNVLVKLAAEADKMFTY